MQKYKLLLFFSARLQQMSFLMSFESLSVFFEQNLSCAKNTKACQFQVHSLCAIAVWAAATNATDRWFLNSKSVFLSVLQTETSEQQASQGGLYRGLCSRPQAAALCPGMVQIVLQALDLIV